MTPGPVISGSEPDATDQLEAVREVLRAISESPFDVDRVLGIVVARMARLCAADMASIFVPSSEGHYRGVATVGMSEAATAYELEHETPLSSGTIIGRTVTANAVVQIEDTAADPLYTWAGREVGGYRTLMGVPIRKESRIAGAVGLGRFEVRPFVDAEVELVQTFADQAAIVIDNVRLLGTIERQREELARYLPATVAELVSSEDGERLLAGHRREVTTVFCDLRGFTAFAEAAEPEEIMTVLRAYHREMGLVISTHGGTLEHFAGDGMMVFLNDPRPIEDHPAAAARMAAEMQARFTPLAEDWRRHGFDLGLGIGIAVGYATLGRVGFEGHFNYAVVGTVANLAARLSSVATAGQIVLSDRAFARIDSIATGEPLGPIDLKGFSRPMAAVLLTALREPPASAD